MTQPAPDKPATKKRKPKTPAQARAHEKLKAQKALTRKRKAEEAAALTDSSTRLAQIVNLHIAGYTLAQIGKAIGATADEVDRMLQEDAARYVRSQPALRVYVRNYVSDKYTRLLDTVWDDATDKTAPKMLESQDRAMRILDGLRKLHGADAPTQTEVTVEAAPEAVDRLVKALSAQDGYAFDENIFDAEVIEDPAVGDRVGDLVHEAAADGPAALARASTAVEMYDDLEGTDPATDEEQDDGE